MIKTTRKVLCLDWDKRTLRIVVARFGAGRTVLEDAHAHRVPNSVDADDPRALGEFIQQMLRRHRIGLKRVVVDVPRERAVIHRLTLPPTPLAEVAAAVRFQAMKELPFPVESAAIDYVVMGRDAQGLAIEVLLAAVTRDTLERMQATCEAAGLTPVRIGLRPYANLVSVRRVPEVAGKRLLFVDVGPGATEIDVMHDGALAFARSANVNIPLPPSDTARTDDSRVISISELGDLEATDEAIEAAGDELLVEVTRTLQAYRATEADSSIDEILVAGGTGLEPQLADRLHRRMGYPVRLFDPTGPLGVDAAEAAKLRSFSAALGLAWGMGGEDRLGLDFLNPKKPVSRKDVVRKRVRIGVLGAAAVVVATVGTLWMHFHERQQVLDGLQTANAALWKDVKEKSELLNRVDEAQEWAAEAVWPEELLVLTELAIDPGEKMMVREIEMETLSKKPSVTLRDVYVTDWKVADDFVTTVNELEIDGRQPYRAAAGTWNTVTDGQVFEGRVRDVTVALEDLRKFLEKADERLKERRERLKRP